MTGSDKAEPPIRMWVYGFDGKITAFRGTEEQIRAEAGEDTQVFVIVTRLSEGRWARDVWAVRVNEDIPEGTELDAPYLVSQTGGCLTIERRDDEQHLMTYGPTGWLEMQSSHRWDQVNLNAE